MKQVMQREIIRKIPDVAEDSQELKTYLVKEGNTAYVYEYDLMTKMDEGRVRYKSFRCDCKLT